MCMVSNVGDGWAEKFPYHWPQIPPEPPAKIQLIQAGVSQAEFDALKKEVQELKKLLIAAKEFDKATGQPDCEMDDKVKLIKAIAKLVGVDMGDVFGNEAKT